MVGIIFSFILNPSTSLPQSNSLQESKRCEFYHFSINFIASHYLQSSQLQRLSQLKVSKLRKKNECDTISGAPTGGCRKTITLNRSHCFQPTVAMEFYSNLPRLYCKLAAPVHPNITPTSSFQAGVVQQAQIRLEAGVEQQRPPLNFSTSKQLGKKLFSIYWQSTSEGLQTLSSLVRNYE